MFKAARRHRRLSMTSLIDVIFLLLLFFMLSSTFSKFSEIELTASGSGQGAAAVPPLFLELGENALRLNGRDVALDELGKALETARQIGEAQPLLVSLKPEATAQRLSDLLVRLRAIQGLQLRILAGGP